MTNLPKIERCLQCGYEVEPGPSTKADGTIAPTAQVRTSGGVMHGRCWLGVVTNPYPYGR